MWLGFKSLSMFSSTLSDGLDTFLINGYFAAVNKFSYEGATRLTDAMFGIKYLMSEDEKENIRAFEYLGEFDGQYLYQNNEALPIAFMVKAHTLTGQQTASIHGKIKTVSPKLQPV